MHDQVPALSYARHGFVHHRQWPRSGNCTMSQALVLISGPEIARGTDFRRASVRCRIGTAAFMARARAIAGRRESRPQVGATGDARGARVFPHAAPTSTASSTLSERGSGLLDAGDTPAFPGVYEAAANVVGGTLEALAAIVAGPARRAFIPIGGLHHAARDGAAGLLRVQRLRRRDRSRAAAPRHPPRRLRRHRRAPRRRRVLRVRGGPRGLRSRTCTRTAGFSIPARAAAARPAAVPPRARSSTSRCRRAPTTRCFSRRGRRSSAISRKRSPS